MGVQYKDLKELLQLEKDGLVSIYCTLNPTTDQISYTGLDLQKYHTNFQDLTFKYRKVSIDKILGFIDCEYYSDVISHRDEETLSITWIYLYAKDITWLSLYDLSQSKGRYVYILTNDAYPGVCKIGKAVNPSDRINQVNGAGTVSEWTLRYALPVTNDYKVENLVHRHLASVRKDSDQGHAREFFEVDFEAAVRILDYLGKDFLDGDPIVY